MAVAGQGGETPVVSVVMSAYNEERRIARAIQSILDQRYDSWELIVVDDCSTDGTAVVILDFASRDPRIHFIANEANLGLAASLNQGIAEANGNYIARMDADDIAYPDRLALQVAFLDTHPEIDVVGGNADVINETGELIRTIYMPQTSEEIERAMIKLNPLIHPTVMFRLGFIQAMGGYDGRLRKKQDYDLWLRGMGAYKYANLKYPLIGYTEQHIKPLSTDLYGFYVRLLNAYRRRNLVVGLYWAVAVFGLNIVRKLGSWRCLSGRIDD